MAESQTVVYYVVSRICVCVCVCVAIESHIVYRVIVSR